jgi:hypothetical protein
MTAAFEKSPPDYVLIVERKAPVDSYDYLGSPGYGRDVMQWIKQNYQVQVLFGHEPLKNGQFGVEILKRSSEPSNALRQPPASSEQSGKTVALPVIPAA